MAKKQAEIRKADAEENKARKTFQKMMRELSAGPKNRRRSFDRR